MQGSEILVDIEMLGDVIGPVEAIDGIGEAVTQQTQIAKRHALIGQRFHRAIGERQARRYFISAEVFTAQQAQEYGLVHIVCDDVDAMEARCNEMLQQLAMNGPEAMKAAKDLVFAVSHKPINDDVIDDTAHRIADIRVGEEGQEGLSAFLNKRKANWVPEEE